MKILNNKKKVEGFQPFSIDILFETGEEAEEFYALFNTGVVCQVSRSLNHEAIRADIVSKMSNHTDWDSTDWGGNLFNKIKALVER